MQWNLARAAVRRHGERQTPSLAAFRAGKSWGSRPAALLHFVVMLGHGGFFFHVTRSEHGAGFVLVGRPASNIGSLAIFFDQGVCMWWPRLFSPTPASLGRASKGVKKRTTHRQTCGGLHWYSGVGMTGLCATSSVAPPLAKGEYW